MAVTSGQPSSRESTAGAGWQNCGGPGTWISDIPAGTRNNSWLRPSTLWDARNDVLAKHLYDPVDRARKAWVRLARERALATGADPNFVLRRGDGASPFSFLLFGDPGEGDASQYAVVPPLLSQAGGVDFAVICSDVIYPTGELGDYRYKFFRPYRHLECPILAVPGNHDWYDGLHGFMSHLCGIDAPDAQLEVGPDWRGRLTRRLWRRCTSIDPADVAAMRADRARPSQRCDPPQPGPYWALDAGPVRIVGIDTGIIGGVDDEQLAWLEQVSLSSDRPKILVTGKPLIVNGHHMPADTGGPVDAIVRRPEARYVMAVGGDTHNYQRYPVTLDDGRLLQYVVNGGGGAYMHATHQIPNVDLDGVTEDDFRCYPLRSDSLARFSELYDRRLTGGRGWLKLDAGQAASYLERLLQIPATREEQTQPLSLRARIAARLLQPAPAKHGFHRFASEFFDWNDPPFFKQFLRLDVERDHLTVRCFGVTGCHNAASAPPVEDEFTVSW